MTNEELYNAIINKVDCVGGRLDKLNEGIVGVIKNQNQIVLSLDRTINTIDRIIVNLD